MKDRFDEPDVEDMPDYIADRASLLNKVFTDHVVWVQSLEAFGRDASLAATWIDHDGEELSSPSTGSISMRISRSSARC